MSFETVKTLLSQRQGSPPARHSARELEPIGDALLDSHLEAYLAECLPLEVLGASGVRLLPLDEILRELELAPAAHLRAYDYVPIATSIGGNVVVVHAWGDRRAKVYWADHTSFSDDRISYQDRTTGGWVDLPGYSPENVERALTPLATDLADFLAELLRDRLTERLDALD